MTKNKLSLLLVMCLCHFGYAQITRTDLILMPFPSQVSVQQGEFRLGKDFKITTEGKAGDRLYAGASRFLRRLDENTGLFFEQEWVTPEAVPGAQLAIKTQRPGEVKLGEDESYQLTVTPQKITLSATTDIGALRGMETLLQLLRTDATGFYFPAVEINDSPRFPWRGLMIDVSRHFQPVNVIKRNIDGMAAVKMNVLHLHLTDDQGFRIESKVYPALTKKASEGQYFTQEEIKDIIQYANDRGIRVMPEFDIPGHATTWATAFPEIASAPGPYEVENNAGVFDPTLDPTNDKTYEILGNFFKEMAALFPDRYFHIGGDENAGNQWNQNKEIQQFMKKNNIKDNHQLQAYFNNKILKLVNSYGKIMVGWDEILHEDLPKNTVIQSWRGPEGLKEAASKGYDVILSNGYYIDLLEPASRHYQVDPIPAGANLTAEERKHVLGGEATMWSELVSPASIDSRIWPRTAAIAERFWSPAEINDVEDMYRRMGIISYELEDLGLQHISNREVIFRNMSNGRALEALRTLADLAEPLEGYKRNNDRMYKMYSPLTLFADAAIADAPLARKFNRLVEDYLKKPDVEKEKEIKSYLNDWKSNYKAIEAAVPDAPLLKSVASLSKNLSTIAEVGLEAFNKDKKTAQWKKEAKEKLEKAREQGARTELQVVDSIEKLALRN